jgi:hypothetical protein
VILAACNVEPQQPEFFAVRNVDPLEHHAPRSYRVWTRLESGTPSWRVYQADDEAHAIAQAREESDRALAFFSRL